MRINKQKLAIIGASYLQLPLVVKARELGLETHCFAWETGAVCKPIVDFFYSISTTESEKILDICKVKNINGILSIASDVAVPTVNYIASKLNLVGNNYADSASFTNKYLMRERFRSNNLLSPSFLRVNIKYPFNSDLNLDYPLIVKPVDRSGSRGVKKVLNRNELTKAIFRARQESFIDECIVEEYINGIEVSVESISWKGEHFILAITDKETTGEPYFVELSHHQPSLLGENIQVKVKAETIRALDALNIYNGASHSEFIITPEGRIFVIEVGARMGGDFIGSDLVYLSTGYDFLKAVIELSLGKFTTPEPKYAKFSGVYFLSKEREHIKGLIDSSNLPQLVKAEITNLELHFLQCSADRSGYLIYQSNEKLII